MLIQTSAIAPVLVAPMPHIAQAAQALPALSPAHRPRSAWPKRRTTLTLQTGLQRPLVTARPHERPITPVSRQPYSHGGYMALTRSFWQDETWLARLTQLMPEARARVDALIGERSLVAALPEMMALLENNPVLAAYGASRAGDAAPPIEWDIWLGPNDAADLSEARVIHGNAVAESLAYAEPEKARILVSTSYAGSDVFTGPSVLAWKSLFFAALDQAGVPPKCGVAQRLFLDVKSTYSSGEDINRFVAALAAEGFEVKGAGTFIYSQLDGLHATLPVRLFDTADDFIKAHALGALPEAATAIFNGGFLLQQKTGAQGLWQIDRQVLRQVTHVQQTLKINLAIYIQETRASWQALDCLTRCINANASIFALGFAYSGIAGLADTTTVVGRGVKMLYAQTV